MPKLTILPFGHMLQKIVPLQQTKVMEYLSNSFDRLREFPYLGRSREELHAGLRSISVGNYNIFYRVQENAIERVRVLHGAEDIGTKFDTPSDN